MSNEAVTDLQTFHENCARTISFCCASCYNSIEKQQRFFMQKGARNALVITTDPIDTNPMVLVLVTDQLSCERLIHAGRHLADQQNVPLEVVNIARFGTASNPEAIELLYQVSRENDAKMTVQYSEEPEKTLVKMLLQVKPANVITGLPGKGSTLLQRLWTRFQYLSFYTVETDGAVQSVTMVDRALA